MLFAVFAHRAHVRVLRGAREVFFRDVAGKEGRLDREEKQFSRDRTFVFGKREDRRGPPGVEMSRKLPAEIRLRLRLFVLPLREALGLVKGFRNGLQVRQDELGRDRLDIGDRIELVRDVHDVLVFETSHDFDDRVHLADVGEELVAEAFSLGRAGDEARDVDELHGRGNEDRRFHDLREGLEAVVGHRHDPDVGLDRAKRVVRGLRLPRARQRVEERRFPDVRQSDDSGFQHELGKIARRVRVLVALFPHRKEL